MSCFVWLRWNEQKKVGTEGQKKSDDRVTYPIPVQAERRYRIVEG